MRNTLFILLISCLFTCREDDSTLKEINHTIIGKWKLIEYSYSIGGPQIIEAVSDGEEITFSSDLTFSSTADHPWNKGTYEITDRQLILIFDHAEIQSFIYSITFINKDEFVLVPKNPACVEGCSSRYRRQ